MIQRRSAKLLTSLQAVSAQPGAILRLLLASNQVLVIFLFLSPFSLLPPSIQTLWLFLCFVFVISGPPFCPRTVLTCLGNSCFWWSAPLFTVMTASAFVVLLVRLRVFACL